MKTACGSLLRGASSGGYHRLRKHSYRPRRHHRGREHHEMMLNTVNPRFSGPLSALRGGTQLMKSKASAFQLLQMIPDLPGFAGLGSSPTVRQRSLNSLRACHFPTARAQITQIFTGDPAPSDMFEVWFPPSWHSLFWWGKGNSAGGRGDMVKKARPRGYSAVVESQKRTRNGAVLRAFHASSVVIKSISEDRGSYSLLRSPPPRPVRCECLPLWVNDSFVSYRVRYVRDVRPCRGNGPRGSPPRWGRHKHSSSTVNDERREPGSMWNLSVASEVWKNTRNTEDLWQ